MANCLKSFYVLRYLRARYFWYYSINGIFYHIINGCFDPGLYDMWNMAWCTEYSHNELIANRKWKEIRALVFAFKIVFSIITQRRRERKIATHLDFGNFPQKNLYDWHNNEKHRTNEHERIHKCTIKWIEHLITVMCCQIYRSDIFVVHNKISLNGSKIY